MGIVLLCRKLCFAELLYALRCRFMFCRAVRVFMAPAAPTALQKLPILKMVKAKVTQVQDHVFDQSV